VLDAQGGQDFPVIRVDGYSFDANERLQSANKIIKGEEERLWEMARWKRVAPSCVKTEANQAREQNGGGKRYCHEVRTHHIIVSFKGK